MWIREAGTKKKVIDMKHCYVGTYQAFTCRKNLGDLNLKLHNVGLHTRQS